MEDFEIVDAHVHITRSRDEEKAHFLFPGRRDRDRWSTPERMIEYMDLNNVSNAAFMILPPRQNRGCLAEKATLDQLSKEQQLEKRADIRRQIGPLMREMNEWGCRVGHQFPRLLPFICISDDLGGPEDLAEEVALRAGQGAKGVKMHPGMFYFSPEDKVFWPMYEKCQKLRIPILADSGPWPTPNLVFMYPSALGYKFPEDERNFGEPKNWVKVLEAFPKLTIILAHLGSAWWDERIELGLKYDNLYFDASQGYSAPDQLPLIPRRSLAEEDAVRVLRKIGVERVMFGTDMPGAMPQPQIDQMFRLPLTDGEKRMILSENARRILKI